MKYLSKGGLSLLFYTMGTFIFGIGLLGSSLYLKLYKDMYFDNSLLIIGLIGIGLSIIFGIFLFKNIKKLYSETLPLSVYITCKNNGITDLNSEYNIEKAKIYAAQFCLKNKDIHLVFEKGEQVWQDQNLKAEDKEIAAIRKTEIQEVKIAEKYAKLTGRNKRIQMYLDSAKEYEIQLNNLRNGIGKAINSTQQKEINWAARGGFVSGIAGGAAGVAAAVDAQMKNVEIRAQNEANKQLIYRAFAGSQEDINFYRKMAKYNYETAKEAETKLVDENNSVDYLSLIEFSNLNSEFSKSGALHISVKAKKKENLIIFDSVEAVIDGTITAEVYQKDKLVGKALLVLPEAGLAGGTLCGICLDKIDSTIPYEIQFKPYKLWAMEK